MAAPDLSLLERTVLGIVHQARGRADWHAVATRLSTLDVPRQPDVLTVLGRLQRLGLVVRVIRGQGADHWAMTARGSALVQADTGAAGVAAGPTATPAEAAGAPAETPGAPAETPGAPAETGAAGPLAPAEAQALARALCAGPMDTIAAIQPLMDDVPRFAAALHQLLTQVQTMQPAAPASAAAASGGASLAEGVAAAARYLPERERLLLARHMAADPRPAVRLGLFRAWAPPRADVQGTGWACLPQPDWDALLRRGLGDPEPAVREHAAALVFGTARGAAVTEELLANLDPGSAPAHAAPPSPAATSHARLRWYTILALGSATDAASLAVLRYILHIGADPVEAGAAVRALAARPDGVSTWWTALTVDHASHGGHGGDDDSDNGADSADHARRRDQVRRAAVFALAAVVQHLSPDQLGELDHPSRPADLRAALASYRARAQAGADPGEPPHG